VEFSGTIQQEIPMKRSRYTETQIVKILKEAEAGVAVEELSRQHGFSRSAFYKWKAKYSGMDASALKRLKELEAENQKLKEMYADLSLEHKVLKDIVEKKLSRYGSAGTWSIT
jgi:putative transposase